MSEIMRYHGGPRDRESEAPHEGFPPPNSVSFLIDGKRHGYNRTGRCHGPVECVHFYAYTGEEDGKTGSAPTV